VISHQKLTLHQKFCGEKYLVVFLNKPWNLPFLYGPFLEEILIIWAINSRVPLSGRIVPKKIVRIGSFVFSHVYSTFCLNFPTVASPYPWKCGDPTLNGGGRDQLFHPQKRFRHYPNSDQNQSAWEICRFPLYDHPSSIPDFHRSKNYGPKNSKIFEQNFDTLAKS